jgi:hypothetical protein
VVLYGAYNPSTGNRVFSEAHKAMLQDPRNAGAVVRLAFVILRLSGLLTNDVGEAKKK